MHVFCQSSSTTLIQLASHEIIRGLRRHLLHIMSQKAFAATIRCRIARTDHIMNKRLPAYRALRERFLPTVVGAVELASFVRNAFRRFFSAGAAYLPIFVIAGIAAELVAFPVCDPFLRRLAADAASRPLCVQTFRAAICRIAFRSLIPTLRTLPAMVAGRPFRRKAFFAAIFFSCGFADDDIRHRLPASRTFRKMRRPTSIATIIRSVISDETVLHRAAAYMAFRQVRVPTRITAIAFPCFLVRIAVMDRLAADCAFWQMGIPACVTAIVLARFLVRVASVDGFPANGTFRKTLFPTILAAVWVSFFIRKAVVHRLAADHAFREMRFPTGITAIMLTCFPVCISPIDRLAADSALRKLGIPARFVAISFSVRTFDVLSRDFSAADTAFHQNPPYTNPNQSDMAFGYHPFTATTIAFTYQLSHLL